MHIYYCVEELLGKNADAFCSWIYSFILCLPLHTPSKYFNASFSNVSLWVHSAVRAEGSLHSTAFPGPWMDMEFLLCSQLSVVDPLRPSTGFEVLHSQAQVTAMIN